MNKPHPLRQRRPRALTCAAGVLWLAAAAHAQTTPPAPAAPAAAGANVPAAGQGQGYHDPRSAFKPLKDIAGVVSWQLLAGVAMKKENKALVPVFPPEVQALNEKQVKVQGFMMPLEPGDQQRHFLLSVVPTTCNFCVPAGPEGLIEVRSRVPVRFTPEAIIVQGRMAVMTHDPYGVYYRVTEARPAP